MLKCDAWRKCFCLFFFLLTAGSDHLYPIRHYAELHNLNLQLGRLY